MKAIISDFSRVLLFPKDINYAGSLNKLNQELINQIAYNALDHFVLNAELLDEYKKFNLPLYIFTSEDIQNRPEFAVFISNFKQVFSAKIINKPKTDPQSYLYIAREIGLPPQELVYIDDNPDNVAAAFTAGLTAFQYSSNDHIIRDLSQLTSKVS